MSTVTNKLTEQVERFWQIEEPMQVASNWSVEEQASESHFTSTIRQLENGRFVVRLPFRQEIDLGDSKANALKRFLHLERKFDRLPELTKQYKKFMHEYLALGHMELVPLNEINNTRVFYLPHHAVFKQTTDGPKIRVVFDASAKTSNGKSLNDNLRIGPTIQDDLFAIVMRFRIHRYVLSADIAKMYRMIKVDPSDCDYQRILWRESPQQPLQTYRLTTVTYGTSCAPFLAVRCLFQVANNIANVHPRISDIIKHDFYVDDLLTGSNSIEEAIELKNQLSNILGNNGFLLCKWRSNCDEIESDDRSSAVMLDREPEGKILGLIWDHHKDQIKYETKLQSIQTSNPITKRVILSTVARIFDPLGLVNPTVVQAKLILQQLWTERLDWDEPVPEHLLSTWSKFVIELEQINTIGIPRAVFKGFPTNCIEIHGFSDASERAYGAAVYLRSQASTGFHVQLLCAKSKVAPLKTISLPRLELNGAVLLARLINKVVASLNITFDKIFYWTDSTIVLCWLKGPANRWKTYVANRVSEIETTCANNHHEWNHVRSGENPADIISRGMSPSLLAQSNLWWHGPNWLSERSTSWPQAIPIKNTPDEVLSEAKTEPQTVAVTNDNKEFHVLAKYSSFNKLRRIVALCLRFVNNCKNSSNKTIGHIFGTEMNRATDVVLRIVQGQAFAKELRALAQGKKLERTSKLISLDPFIDDRGIIRVGGRLRHAKISYDQRFPVVLPEKHHVTELIIRTKHEENLHSGREATLAATRHQYWPIGGRNLIKKVIKHCVRCARINPPTITQKMGDLPASRTQPMRPFYTSGVDYAGPILVKEGRGRGKRQVKAYIAVFICFTTKAVHLELVSSLTTEAFLAALKRFTSRRGNVAHMFSDNGKNFVGANRELKALLKSSEFRTGVISPIEKMGTNWHFIPPSAPNFGGLWEGAVKNVKYHIKRVLRNSILTFEELYTFLTCVEASLNSRPLTPISNDPNDLSTLTPGHFLIGDALTTPLEPNVMEIQMNRLSRWQQIERLRQHFWKRWSSEYLTQVHPRPKGQRTQQDNIKIDAIVLIAEDNLPPQQWVIGRVQELHPGSDGIVRVATVRTQQGTFKRPVRKLRMLPVECDTQGEGEVPV